MADFPEGEKPFSRHRWASVLVRSLHISAMGVVLGGVFIGADHMALAVGIWVTALSGTVLLAMDFAKDRSYLLQGSGLFVLLKLALLAVGLYFLPGQRFGWYLAATFVASIGSHMPGAVRHCKVVGKIL